MCLAGFTIALNVMVGKVSAVEGLESLPAQSLDVPETTLLIGQRLPPQPTLPDAPPPSLPDLDELLRSPLSPTPVPDLVPDPILDDTRLTVFVERFEVMGSTVFSDAELAAVLEPFTNRELSLTELYAARSAITQLYIDQGYVLSGAFIPPQEPENDVVQIQVIEGRLTEIQVSGNQRLRSPYIRNRLALAGDPPLQLDDLVDENGRVRKRTVMRIS
ncbi:MAG: ShlB/FhaC/HecB family hemolysin secretion/activation protein, partial [Cyanothece sp. SIO2G6]|nr:ShlB/FhaC/HecB family hemolysin secretion/activation protein [Cyanothece sp. SIO2G6]